MKSHLRRLEAILGADGYRGQVDEADSNGLPRGRVQMSPHGWYLQLGSATSAADFEKGAVQLRTIRDDRLPGLASRQ